MTQAPAIVSSEALPAPAPWSTGVSRQLALAGLLLVEIALFSCIGTHFLTFDNLLEVLRRAVEPGLLALAMTPVIVTGGIDLSVGSILGLSAVVLGMTWKDGGASVWIASAAALAVGGIAGTFNGLFIARFRGAPLIVTLGTLSLYRGLAEGITGGARNYTGFPGDFRFLGIGSIGPVPAQLPLLAIAAVGFYLLLHRSSAGRALSAIGYSPGNARYAGLPVERRVALTYILSGLAAGLAAIVYVAHHGQVKADAGAGYELMAITAVVMGGTSIFGGRGSIAGTLTGLLAIAVLHNGLNLASIPALGIYTFPQSVADMLTGLLLLGAIGLDLRPSARSRAAKNGPASQTAGASEEFEMKNGQLAFLGIVILAAAAIVAGANAWLVKSIERDLAGSNAARAGAPAGATPAGPTTRLTIAGMPKSLGNAYFGACKRGADEAAKTLGVELIWNGPTSPEPAEQNEIVEDWITRGVDAIAVAVENRGGLSATLRKAREKGIKVVTYDSDADPDARDFFVNQATSQAIGDALMDNAADVMKGHGDFAVISGSLTAQNMIDWEAAIEGRRAAKYPDIHETTMEPCDDKQEVAFAKTKSILSAHPEVKLIMAICSPGVPGAAEAVQQSGRTDVKVIGLGLPNDNKTYVHAGITQRVILWNPMDLGYLAIYAARDVKTGALKRGDTSIDAGRLGKLEVRGDNIILGKPVVFTKENIDQFNF